MKHLSLQHEVETLSNEVARLRMMVQRCNELTDHRRLLQQQQQQQFPITTVPGPAVADQMQRMQNVVQFASPHDPLAAMPEIFAGMEGTARLLRVLMETYPWLVPEELKNAQLQQPVSNAKPRKHKKPSKHQDKSTPRENLPSVAEKTDSRQPTPRVHASPEAQDLYKRNYKAVPQPPQSKVPFHTVDEHGIPQCKFLQAARHKLNRDYILLVDRSGSMSGDRWKEAEEAVKALSAHITKFDPDGVDIIFFDHKVVKFENVKKPEAIVTLFAGNAPRGSTNLAAALDCAFLLHFNGTRGATTILCITDGGPDSYQEVIQVIHKASNSLVNDPELSVSFIQVGTDPLARKFLKKLDDDLNGKFDIVDTISAERMHSISFNELIQLSIDD